MVRSQQQQQHQQRDQQSRVFYELSALVLSLLRSPPIPVPLSDQSPPSTRRPVSWSSSPSLAQMSPTGFASLLLGISVALMMCGFVTFFLGFMLFPWVLGLIMLLYIAGIVSAISMVCRSILCYAMPPPTSPRKEIPAWKLFPEWEKLLRNGKGKIRE